MTVHVREDAELVRLTERLKAQFAGTVPAEEVERTVVDTAAGMADAPIRLFVPLLVERGAREALRARRLTLTR